MESPILWHTFFFVLFALMACIFAVAVVISGNIVRMAFYLILSLGATSGLFFLAGADFVAAMQLMIYVGATLVLLIFGVMLTARSPFLAMKTRGSDWILAAIVGGSLLAVLIQTALSVDNWRHGASPQQYAAAGDQSAQWAAAETANDEGNGDERAWLADPRRRPSRTATELGMGLLGNRVDRLGPDEAATPGLSGYLLPFEIVSVHLLVVLIGAAYLARAKKRVKQSSDRGKSTEAN